MSAERPIGEIKNPQIVKMMRFDSTPTQSARAQMFEAFGAFVKELNGPDDKESNRVEAIARAGENTTKSVWEGTFEAAHPIRRNP